MINHTKWPLDRNETLKLQDDPSATLIPQHFPVSTPIVVDPSARTGIVGEKSTKMVGLSARREHCRRKVELIPPQPDLSFLRSLLRSVRCSFRCSFLLHAFRLRSSRCLPTASLRSYRCLPIANLRSSRCSPATTSHPPLTHHRAPKRAAFFNPSLSAHQAIPGGFRFSFFRQDVIIYGMPCRWDAEATPRS